MLKPIMNLVEGIFGSKNNTNTNRSVQKTPLATYREETGNGLLSTFFNKGNYGEFLTYKNLSKLPGKHRVVFNIYLPKGNEKTTEIDLVYIHETGIYVIESKNYSGWIFGDEKNRNWTQTMPNGKKYKFYNPIWQNKGHVSALQALLPSVSKECYKSVVVFSERCTLKKVNYESSNTFVIKRYDVKKLLLNQFESSANVMDSEYIDKVYNFLSQYSRVDSEVKKEHIQNINLNQK